MCTHWSDSNHGYSESSAHGESEGWGESHMTGISHTHMTCVSNSETYSMPSRTYSIYVSATASPRVRGAAVPLEREIRAMARSLTVQEFNAVRTRIEDFFDEVLLNYLP